jgi:hypothetical protein
MKKIEGIILFILFGITIMCLVVIVGNHFGLLDVSSEKIINISLFGFLSSGFSMIVCPLWNVGNYLKTNSIKKTLDYRIRYKIPYTGLAASFIGLIILSVAESNKNHSLSLILLYILGLSFLLNGLAIFWLSFKNKID